MYALVPNYGKEFKILNHFLTLGGEDNFLQTVSGGTVNGNLDGTANNPGWNQLSSTTGVADTAQIRQNAGSALLGGGDWFIQGIIQVVTLSTALEEYVLHFGLFDGTSADAVDGVYFEYDRATAGDVWRTVAANNSTRTKNTSASAVVAGTIVRLGIEINAAATRVRFYVNGVLIDTITTNIPTAAGRVTGFSFGYRKTVGITAVNVAAIDHVLINHNLTNPIF